MRVAAAVVAFLWLAPPASAHVTVVPDSARPGETRTFTFRVLNERSGARTVRIALFAPAGVAAQGADRPGWTRTGGTDWAAHDASAAISGASAKDFEVRVGPLPDGDRVVFKVLQYYSDGQIVRWIQSPDPSAERPAPAITLAPARRAASGGASEAGFVTLGLLVVIVLAAGVLLLRRRPAAG